MGKMFTEEKKVIQLDKEQFDLWRSDDISMKTVCRAPFVSLEIRESGTVNPCSHSEMNLGHLGSQTLESIWNGPGFGQLRHRFHEYRVKEEECRHCVNYWKEGLPAKSPAIAEFDNLKISRWGAPYIPQVLSLDLRAPFSALDTKSVFRWLSRLAHLKARISWPESKNSFFQKLIDRVAKLPGEKRPKVTLQIDDTIPEADGIPNGVTAVTLHLAMNDEKLSSSQDEMLEELSHSLQARGVSLVLEVSVNQENWIHLCSWLPRARRLGILLRPLLVSPSEHTSLSHLDGDVLACLHDIFERWLSKDTPPPLQPETVREIQVFLDQLCRWQEEAAGRSPQRKGLTFPDPRHFIVQDEATLESFLGSFLRIYSDPSIERWLIGLSENKRFAIEARDRRSFRFVALWLACVFDHAETLVSLKDIFRNPKAASRLVREDQEVLAGTVWESWFDSWAEQLNLKSLKLRTRRFPIGPPQENILEEPATITVLLPTYNQQAFIGEAIHSVLAQTRTDFRLLVIDDASQDETVNEAKKIKDSRIQIIQNPENLREGESLARALENVETEYVAFMEGDDLFHPKRLERCISFLEESPTAEMVATELTVIDSQRRVCSTSNSSPVFDGLRNYNWLRWFEDQARLTTTPEDFLGVLLEANSLITCSNIVGRTHFLRKHQERWKRLQFCIDWQLYLTAAFDHALSFVPENLLGYRLHQSNQSHNFAEKADWHFYLESSQVLAKILDDLLQRPERSNVETFTKVLSAMTDHANSNTSVDWPGVVLGFVLERLSLTSGDITNHSAMERVQGLIEARDERLRSKFFLADWGGNMAEQRRIQGEAFFLRSRRNQYDGLLNNHARLQGEVTGLLYDRDNVRKLWRKAEQERDQAISVKESEVSDLTQWWRKAEEERAQAILDKESEISVLTQWWRKAEEERDQAIAAKESEVSHITRLWREAEQERDHAISAMTQWRRQAEEERDQAKTDRRMLNQENEDLRSENECLQGQLGQRIAEHDDVLNSLERRAGDLLLNRLHLRPLFRRLEWLKVGISMLPFFASK